MELQDIKAELKARGESVPRSKAEAAKKLKKVQNVRPDYSKLKKKELDELAEEIGVDGTKKEMAEKLQAVSDGPTDTPESAEILQQQLQSGKRATKKAVKDFLEDADDILNFFKLTQKINKETDKKMKAEVVGTDQDDKNIELITDYRKKHGWANYHSQKEIPIHEAMLRRSRGLPFDDDGCIFRGPKGRNPVYMSICYPLRMDEGDCSKRICFDAREILKQRKKDSYVNPLVSGAGDLEFMAPQVDEGFFELLELRLELEEAGIANGMKYMEVSDKVFVDVFFEDAIKKVTERFPFLMTMGNVWNKFTSNRIFNWVNSKKKGYLGRVSSLPFFSLILPFMSDVFMMMMCVIATGSANDVRVAFDLLQKQFRGQPVVSYIIEVCSHAAECMSVGVNALRGNVFSVSAWSDASKCIYKIGSATTLGSGLNLVRKGILAIITETMRAIFGHDGYLSSSVGVKELGTEINTTPYTLFESIMWYLGYRNKGKDNQKALFDQFSGITQAHNTVTLILLFVAAQQPFWVWAGFFKILFRTFFWVAKTTVASLGVVASTTTGPLGSKGVNAVVKLFDTMEKEILALITELEKSGDSVLTFVRRFLLIFKPIYLNTMAVRNTIYVMQQWWDQVFGCLLKNLLFGPADTKDTNCCLAKFRKEIKDIDADKKDEEEMNKINRQFDLAKERIEKQDKYAYETQVKGDYYGKKVATAFMKPTGVDKAIIATNRAWKSFRNTNIAQAILNAKMEEQRGQRSDLLGIDTPKSPVFNGLDQYDEAVANAESDSEYFKGFKSRLGDLTRQVGPAETFFLICSKHPVESLCESVFGEAPDAVLLKQIYEFIWETRYADDTRRYKLYRAFRPVVLRDMQLNSTGPVPEPEPEPEPFGLSSLFGLLGFQDNPARVVSNDVPGDGNCFFYALFRALAHKDFPYLDQLRECFGIDTTSERVFAASMRRLIANAFDGFMAPEINNRADQSAMVYYQAVYSSSENDANAMTCIPTQRGLTFDAYKQVISQRVRSSTCWMTDVDGAVAAYIIGHCFDNNEFVQRLAMGQPLPSAQEVERADRVFVQNVGVGGNPNHFKWLSVMR